MVYSSALASSHTVLTNILDVIDPKCDWNTLMNNCVFFTSELTASQLAKHFESSLGTGPGKFYLITEVSSNKQGRLSERSWRLLNNPNNPRGA